tara:strand:- start:161 stop:280 length:120 start_codon:yes stop_codon:yes gene_type:complete
MKLWCKGGEKCFIKGMIVKSKDVGTKDIEIIEIGQRNKK